MTDRGQYFHDLHQTARPMVAFRLMSPADLETLRAAAATSGSVSKFIREAIAEKLEKEQTTK